MKGSTFLSQSATAAESLARRIKQETAQQHREIEDSIGIPRWLDSTSRYRHLLERFYGFYAPLERMLASSRAAEQRELAMGERQQKARWLAEDLCALEQPDFSNLPECGELPNVNTLPAALGTMYVLEGSTLGGRQIRGMLHGGALSGSPHRFFSSYGAETGAMWMAFCAVLNAVDDGFAQALAIENARATFASFRKWMQKPS